MGRASFVAFMPTSSMSGGSFAPMENSPPGIHTIPAGVFAGGTSLLGTVGPKPFVVDGAVVDGEPPAFIGSGAAVALASGIGAAMSDGAGSALVVAVGDPALTDWTGWCGRDDHTATAIAIAAAMMPMLQALRLLGVELAADCDLLGCFFTADWLKGLRSILVLESADCHIARRHWLFRETGRSPEKLVPFPLPLNP